MIVKATASPSLKATARPITVPPRQHIVTAKASRNDREQETDLRSVAMGALAAMLLAAQPVYADNQLDALTGNPLLGQKQPNEAVPTAVQNDLGKVDSAITTQPTGAVRQAAQDVKELVQQQANALARPSGPDDNKAEQLVKNAGDRANQSVKKVSDKTDELKDKSRSVLDKTGDLVRGIANKADKATSNSGNIKAQPTDEGVEQKGFFNKGTIGPELKSKGLFSMLPMGNINAGKVGDAAEAAGDKAKGVAGAVKGKVQDLVPGLTKVDAQGIQNRSNDTFESLADERKAKRDNSRMPESYTSNTYSGPGTSNVKPLAPNKAKEQVSMLPLANLGGAAEKAKGLAAEAGDKAKGAASDVANKTGNLFEGGSNPLGAKNAENQREAANSFGNLTEERRNANSGGDASPTKNINLLGESKAKRGGVASLPVNPLPLANISASSIGDAADSAASKAKGLASDAKGLASDTKGLASDAGRKARGVASDVANKSSNLFQAGENNPLGRRVGEIQSEAANRFEQLTEERRRANSGGDSRPTANINLLGESKTKRGGFATMSFNLLPFGNITSNISNAADDAAAAAKGVANKAGNLLNTNTPSGSDVRRAADRASDKVQGAAADAGSKARGIASDVANKSSNLSNLGGRNPLGAQNAQNQREAANRFEQLTEERRRANSGGDSRPTANINLLGESKAKRGGIATMSFNLLPFGNISASSIGNAASNAADSAASKAQDVASGVARRTGNLFQGGEKELGAANAANQREAAARFEELVENRRRANSGGIGAARVTNIQQLGETAAKGPNGRVAIKLGHSSPYVLALMTPDAAAPDTSSSIADKGKSGREAAERLVNATEGRKKGQFTAQQGGENTDPQKNINAQYLDSNQTNPEVQADNKRKGIFNQADPKRDEGMPGEQVTDQAVQGVQSNLAQVKSILGL